MSSTRRVRHRPTRADTNYIFRQYQHNIDTQASDVYDKATHSRLTQASFDFTAEYALACQEARDRGEAMPSTATGERTASSSSAVAKGADGKKKAGKSGGAATTKSKPKVKKAAKKPTGGKQQKPPPSTPPRPPVGAAAEAEATPTPAVRPSDVVQGTRVRVYFGPEAGWCAGVVQEPYDRSMGHYMDDFEEAPDWPASTDAAWVIEFDDGDVLCLSLSEARRGRGSTDGNWCVEKPSRRIMPTGTFTFTGASARRTVLAATRRPRLTALTSPADRFHGQADDRARQGPAKRAPARL